MAPARKTGKIFGVSGPVVTAQGVEGVKMYEVAKVGHLQLTGEVIRIDHDHAIIQCYEDTCKSDRYGSAPLCGVHFSRY
jgi:vacuolar-type H+-ATPase catalytic subunit A/Vma1